MWGLEAGVLRTCVVETAMMIGSDSDVATSNLWRLLPPLFRLSHQVRLGGPLEDEEDEDKEDTDPTNPSETA